MKIINFSHPLNSEEIQKLIGVQDTEVITVPVVIRPISEIPLAEQIRGIVDAVGFTAEQWQTTPFLINIPGFGSATAGVLAEIHGRTGHFPTMLILERQDGAFKIAGTQDLQSIREQARSRRF
jgi:hypothetical protein